MKRHFAYRWFSVICLTLLALCIHGTAWGYSVTPTNNGFETQSVAVGTYTDAITGWTKTGTDWGGGVFHPAIGPPKPAVGYTNPVPNPVNVAWAWGTTTFKQVLTAELIQPNYLYTLQVYVGRWDNSYEDPSAYQYKIQIAEGTGGNILSTAIGLAPYDGFTAVQVSWISDSSYIGNPLEILFGANNNVEGTAETDFDLVTLQANQVPVPGTLLLFGTGLTGLGYMRRRLLARKK